MHDRFGTGSMSCSRRTRSASKSSSQDNNLGDGGAPSPSPNAVMWGHTTDELREGNGDHALHFTPVSGDQVEIIEGDAPAIPSRRGRPKGKKVLKKVSFSTPDPEGTSRAIKKLKVENTGARSGLRKVQGKELGVIISSHPGKLSSLNSQLNLDQKAAVRRIGFGGLLDMDFNDNPPGMAHWFVNALNHNTMEVVEGDKVLFKVQAKDVFDIFGLPHCEGKSVKLDVDNKVREIRKSWDKDFSIPRKPGSKTYLTLLRRTLDGMTDDSDDFIRLYVLYALSTFLVPQSSGLVDFKPLQSLVVVDSIPKVNWAGYVFEKMQASAERYTVGKQVYWSGCYLLLLLVYLRNLPPVANPETSPHPYIRGCSYSYVTEKLLSLQNTGGFWKPFILENFAPDMGLATQEGHKRDAINSEIQNSDPHNGGGQLTLHIGYPERVEMLCRDVDVVLAPRLRDLNCETELECQKWPPRAPTESGVPRLLSLVDGALDVLTNTRHILLTAQVGSNDAVEDMVIHQQSHEQPQGFIQSTFQAVLETSVDYQNVLKKGKGISVTEEAGQIQLPCLDQGPNLKGQTYNGTLECDEQDCSTGVTGHTLDSSLAIKEPDLGIGGNGVSDSFHSMVPPAPTFEEPATMAPVVDDLDMRVGTEEQEVVQEQVNKCLGSDVNLQKVTLSNKAQSAPVPIVFASSNIPVQHCVRETTLCNNDQPPQKETYVLKEQMGNEGAGIRRNQVLYQSVEGPSGVDDVCSDRDYNSHADSIGELSANMSGVLLKPMGKKPWGLSTNSVSAEHLHTHTWIPNPENIHHSYVVKRLSGQPHISLPFHRLEVADLCISDIHTQETRNLIPFDDGVDALDWDVFKGFEEKSIPSHKLIDAWGRFLNHQPPELFTGSHICLNVVPKFDLGGDNDNIAEVWRRGVSILTKRNIASAELVFAPVCFVGKKNMTGHLALIVLNFRTKQLQLLDSHVHKHMDKWIEAALKIRKELSVWMSDCHHSQGVTVSTFDTVLVGGEWRAGSKKYNAGIYVMYLMKNYSGDPASLPPIPIIQLGTSVLEELRVGFCCDLVLSENNKKKAELVSTIPMHIGYKIFLYNKEHPVF